MLFVVLIVIEKFFPFMQPEVSKARRRVSAYVK